MRDLRRWLLGGALLAAFTCCVVNAEDGEVKPAKRAAGGQKAAQQQQKAAQQQKAEQQKQKAAEARQKVAEGREKAAQVQQDLEELVLTGRIEKEEISRQDKDTGETRQITRFVLVDADGNKAVLRPARKGAQDAVDPAAFVGQQVKLTGKGVVKVRKRGDKEQKAIMVHSVDSIEAAVGGDADDQ